MSSTIVENLLQTEEDIIAVIGATIVENLSRVEEGKNDIISALSLIGIIIPEGTVINDIASYIRGYGVFRGTRLAYEEAYAAGNIPVGTIVVIDDGNETTAVLGKAILGKMILGTE